MIEELNLLFSALTLLFLASVFLFLCDRKRYAGYAPSINSDLSRKSHLGGG